MNPEMEYKEHRGNHQKRSPDRRNRSESLDIAQHEGCRPLRQATTQVLLILEVPRLYKSGNCDNRQQWGSLGREKLYINSVMHRGVALSKRCGSRLWQQRPAKCGDDAAASVPVSIFDPGCGVAHQQKPKVGRRSNADTHASSAPCSILKDTVICGFHHVSGGNLGTLSRGLCRC